ncbi:unnamed protein product, partial [Oikopleura dioica]
MKTSAEIFEELLMSEALDNENTITELLKENESKSCFPKFLTCGKAKKKKPKSKKKKKTRNKMGLTVTDGPSDSRENAINDIVFGLNKYSETDAFLERLCPFLVSRKPCAVV